MPYSGTHFDNRMVYLMDNYSDPEWRGLDIGGGAGKFSKLFRKHLKKLDAI